MVEYKQKTMERPANQPAFHRFLFSMRFERLFLRLEVERG